MARRPFTNDVPIAPFSLIGVEPLKTQEVYERLGRRRYLAARGKVPEPRATLDPNPCPTCGMKVEWAYTFKRDDTHPKGGENYVYARCTASPAAHRWAFRKAGGGPAPVEAPTPEIEAPTPEVQKEETVSKPPAGSFDALIQAVVDQSVGARLTEAESKLAEMAKTATLDPEAVKAMIAEALANARKVEITIPAMPEAKFTGKAHPMLERLLQLIAVGETFFMICGPAASGKSTLAKQVATTLKKKLTAVSINEIMTREEILGWRAPNLTTGEQKYTASATVEGWERGDVILFDEVDRGNPNTLCALNSIEQRVLYVPRAESEGGSESRMGEGAVVICTANTFGTGASRTYVGANQLDAAFLDRFRVLEVGYDRDLEIEITGSPEAVTLMESARKRADERSVRRPLTTRMIRRAVTDSRVMKCGLKVAFQVLCEDSGWSRTEVETVWN